MAGTVQRTQIDGVGGRAARSGARPARAWKEFEMGLNAWLRGHPLLYALIGAVIIAIGAVRGQPIAIGVGVIVILFGLGRAFLL